MQRRTAHARKVYARASAIGLAVFLAACSSGELVAVVTPTPVPSSGTVTVSMTAAPLGLSAVQLRVVGAGVSAPAAGDGARIVLKTALADTTLVVVSVSGSAPATLLTFAVANVEQPVSVVVQEASAGRHAGYQALLAADVTVAVSKR